ncbi:MAG: IgA Peptidase M64 [Acidobacteria bacterium]|nr:IgA Peptidase M64 [Acidobacteriota bacterium]
MAQAPQAQSRFEAYFTDRTLRLDYFHTGDANMEIVAGDRIVSDGPWAGSRIRLLDDTNLGKYFFEVMDRGTNQILYSRGFASIYGEWETTDEAKKLHRTFHESLRFPWPKRPVQVVLKKRDPENSFHEIWSTVVDPNSRFVNPAMVQPRGRVWTLLENGAPQEKVDLLILGEGYAEAELAKFHADAKRLVDALFALEPFKSRKSDFNVRAIDLPSPQSGINRPRSGDFRRTPLRVEYNIFDTDRYILTYDNSTLRDVASAAPYEFIEILVNEKKYGGGGIFNFQATTAVDTAYADYIFIHEFGHHFAGLADEYYTSPVAYATGAAEHPEPWEPNVTALGDPANLKWRDLVETGTPIPTLWNKDAYDKQSWAYQARRRELIDRNAPEGEVDKLMREQQDWESKFLSSLSYFGKVGAFEGASYEPKGLYRPQLDCIMFSRNPVAFCRVCRRAIERVIDQYSRPG